MIALEQARLHLEQLGLTQSAAMLDSRLQHATQKELPYVEFLVDLLRVEVAARRERYLKARGWPTSLFTGRWSSLISLSSHRWMNGWSTSWPRSAS